MKKTTSKIEYSLFFALLCLLAVKPAQANDSFQELAENCRIAVSISERPHTQQDLKPGELQSSASCWSYLAGFQQGLAWYAIKRANSSLDKTDVKDVVRYLPFCIPGKVTSKQQALMLINHHERNPAHGKWPAAAVFGEIMLEHFPCKK